MGTKNNPGKFDCYANALPDEPMFVLLARDPRAPARILEWAVRSAGDIILGRRPESDIEMVTEAVTCATEMRVWRERNEGAWRKLDLKPPPPRELRPGEMYKWRDPLDGTTIWVTLRCHSEKEAVIWTGHCFHVVSPEALS